MMTAACGNCETAPHGSNERRIAVSQNPLRAGCEIISAERGASTFICCDGCGERFCNDHRVDVATLLLRLRARSLGEWGTGVHLYPDRRGPIRRVWLRVPRADERLEPAAPGGYGTAGRGAGPPGSSD